MEAKTPLVTVEAVRAAAEALSATGRKVSVRAVIAELGGGSPNTVLAHLKSWRATQPEVANATPVMIDARILQILREQVAASEEKALAGAAARVAEIEEDNAAIAEEVMKLQGELLQRDAALEAVRTECDKAIANAAEQVREARAEAARERAAAVATHDALAVAQARLEELPSLKDEIDNLRAELATEGAARAAAEQAAAVARATQEAEGKALAKTEKDLTAAHAELEKRQAYIYGLTDEIHKRQDLVYEINAKLTIAEEQLRAAQEELAGGGADARAIARLEEARRQAVQQGASEAHLQRIDAHIEARKQLMVARREIWVPTEPDAQQPAGKAKPAK
ncbi:DNA-binding protein [Cupriavidus sp. IK-TO18]|uniref:DNA-binding protein n=1 Tax=Cupriavidus sp. IK-TO18 TaxID=2782182 RepID=UPI001896E975|nr:DNA-binding protein [Cupriavidus sp. IK-TO18]MBF6989284.1 DNA-binding protein [Cupriavidus sp. IK-TO18]